MTYTNNVRPACGKLVFHVRNSNINGDPDAGGGPRIDPSGHAIMSNVSLKRRLRDHLHSKDASVWRELAAQFDLDENRFGIFETKDRNFANIRKLLESDGGIDTFCDTYWDARLFGNTLIEKGLKKDNIRTGVVQFSLGRTVAKVQQILATTTRVNNQDEDKDSGMAPHSIKVIQDGLFVMDYNVQVAHAHRTRCTQQDVDVMLQAIAYCFSQCDSVNRTHCHLVHHWHIEFPGIAAHRHYLNVLEAFQPKSVIADDYPDGLADYHIPTLHDAPVQKVISSLGLVIRDYMSFDTNAREPEAVA